MIGQRLGPYEITAKLGEGGMGEVYRATDTKLKREVAIKVLPQEFTADPERLARFEREAQLLAQLHHPNIASIFGLEESSDVRALVMELVEGPTLADRLTSGPLPLAESLAIAVQIAQALDEAHAKGIIHRDLKPQNVKASMEGTVKVLDFGLAKAMDPLGTASGPGSASQLAASPTLTLGATQMGMILGTAAYMSPEQAKGFTVDKRADIWAFGVVLYEMLTGARLFEAPTVPETLAQVLTRTPDLDALPASTPPAIRRLLRRCLERNPKNRLHDVADARIVLDDVLSGRHVEGSAAMPGATEPARGLLRPPVVAAVTAAAIALGIAIGWLSHRPASPDPMLDSRWALAIPDGLTLSTADMPQVAISRDGLQQAMVVVDGSGIPRLLLRRANEFEPRLLPGTERAATPFFSPDGAWIGFFRDTSLYKMPVSGGPPVRLAESSDGNRGATWSRDGFVYFSPDSTTSILRVSENGGEVRPVTQLDAARNERTHRWPQALPGGDGVLFTCDTVASTEYYDDARIEVVRPSTGERKVLVEGSSQARYSPSGHLVFARGGSLYAVAFDPRSLEVHGAPVEVAQGVATNVGSGAVMFALSESGAALWMPGGPTAVYRLVWIDRTGRETEVPVPPAPYNEAALSPDGRKVALVGGEGGVSDLWISDLERGTLTRLTTGEIARNPVWTPDGARVAYSIQPARPGDGEFKIAWRPADGSRDAETLLSGPDAPSPRAFAAAGRVLLLDNGVDQMKSGGSIWELPMASGSKPRQLVAGPFTASEPSVSPDDRWLAYVSDESGQNNVYVRPYPSGEGRWQISLRLGIEPRWSHDGRELFYRADSVLYRVTIDTSHGFSAGRPEPLFDRVASGSQISTYSLSPDGKRFLTFRAPEGVGSLRTLFLDLGFARRLSAAGAQKR